MPIQGKEKLIDLYDHRNPLAKQWLKTVDQYRSRHTEYFQSMFGKKKPRIVKRLLISEISGLWWEKWRYKYGADNLVYKNVRFSATGGQPNPLESTPPILLPPTHVIKVPSLRTVSIAGTSAASMNRPISISKKAPNNTSAAKPIAAQTVAQQPKKRAAKNAKTALYLGAAAVAVAAVTIGLLLRRTRKR